MESSDALEAEITRLRKEISQEGTWKKKLGELNVKYYKLVGQVREYHRILDQNQELSIQLRRRSVRTLFLRLFGKRKRQLQKAEEAVREAERQCREKGEELARFESEIRLCENRIFRIGGLRRKLEQLEQEKFESAGAALSGPRAEEFRAIEAEAELERRHAEELRCALSAGRAAYETAGSIMIKLDNAERLGKHDMFSSGILVDLDKHQNLHLAELQLEDLRSQLKNFRTELGDVSLPEELRLEVTGFLRFADYFFDDMLSGWSVKKRVEKAAKEIMQLRRRLEGMLECLEAQLAESGQETERKKAELNRIIAEKE